MHGRVNVVRMPATCRAPWKKIMHKRAKISGHINQLIAERSVKHANDNKGQGIRANSGKSEGGNLELTTCTHTHKKRKS